MGDTLVASLNGNRVEAVKCRQGCWRVHAAGAAAIHKRAVTDDVELVLLLAADHRVQAMTTHANGIDAGQTSQKLTDIRGRRYIRPVQFGFTDEGQALALDDNTFENFCLLSLSGQGESGGGKQNSKENPA